MAEQYYIDRKDNKHRLYGLVGTIGIHSLIIGIMLIIMIQAPNPPWETEGMTMSLGEENMGGPSTEPVNDPQPNEQYIPIEEQTETPEELTTEDPESEAIKEEKKTKPVEKVKDIKPNNTETKPQLELPKKVNQQALFTKRNKSDNQGGYGDGEVPGNEGRPDGSPDGNPDGNGTGNSGYGSGNSGNGPVRFELSGRKLKQIPGIEDNSKSTGKVVVRIVVDRDGNVVQAVPGQVGSTTTDPILLSKAKEGAMRAKFSNKEDAPEQQYGTMTVYFRYQP